MPAANPYFLKIKSVLPLFAVVAWGSVLVLGVVRWCFVSGKYQALEVNEDVWEIYIPAFIAFAPIWFWMKFERLTFSKKPKEMVMQLQLIGYFTLFGMLAISQAYLSTFESKMVTVKDVKEIGKMPEARYYKIDTFAVHKFIGGALTFSTFFIGCGIYMLLLIKQGYETSSAA